MRLVISSAALVCLFVLAPVLAGDPPADSAPATQPAKKRAMRPGEFEFQSKPARRIPDGVIIRVFTDKPKYFLGENIFLHYEIKNASPNVITVGSGNDSFWPRPLRYHIQLLDQQGNLAPDPFPGTLRDFEGGGPGGDWEVQPVESFYLSAPLMLYRTPQSAGKYTVRMSHDLGWAHLPPGPNALGYNPPAPDDIRWVSTTLELVMPTPEEARQVVQATLDQKDGSATPGNKTTGRPDFSCLCYPVYLPELTRLAQQGDTRAFSAIGGIATLDATKMLIAGLSSKDRQYRMGAISALSTRLPDPRRLHLDPDQPAQFFKYPEVASQLQRMVDLSWRDEFAEPVLAYARKVLKDGSPLDGMGATTRPSKNTRDDEMESAIYLLAAIAPPSELPTLTDAYDRMLIRSAQADPESTLIRSMLAQLKLAIQALLARGAKPAVVPSPKSPGQIAVFLLSLKPQPFPTDPIKHDPIKQDQLKTNLLTWLNHDIPYIQCLTLERFPVPCPPWATQAVIAQFASLDVDVDVRRAAAAYAGKSKDLSFGPTLLNALRKDPDAVVASSAHHAATQLGIPQDEICLAAADRLVIPMEKYGDLFTAMSHLTGLFSGGTGASHSNEPAPSLESREKLRAAWINVIQLNRDAIRAGTKLTITDLGVTPDLLPERMNLFIKNNPWPSRLAR